MEEDRKDNIRVAVICVIFSGLFVTAMNAFAKLAAQYYDVLEIVFYRGLFALALLCLYIGFTGKWQHLKTRRPVMHLLRSIMGTISICLVYLSYSLMPMADATALLMTSGLIITALSAPFLGEKVGPWRWSAVIVGFLGALLIIDPGGNKLDSYSSLVAVTAAFTIASVNLLLRKLGRSEAPLATIFYFMTTSVTLTGLYVLLVKGINLETVTLHLLAAVGIFSLLQQIAKTYASVLADASLLSPYSYLSLLWAVIFGVVIWGDWPPFSVWLGGGIIIAANGFVLWRERIKHKRLVNIALLD